MNTKHFLLLIFIVPLGITFTWAGEDHLSIYELDDFVVQSSPLQLSTSEKTQSTTVLDQSALNETRSDTIAATLSQQAGVAQSYYGPHSNRPIIRGLDGFRVTILENGLSAFDLSATSADHAVSIDPLMVDRIEILRGSSSMIFGSNALGGIVNVYDKGIPNLYEGNAFKNEYRTRLSSANDGIYNGGILYHQLGNFVFQLNASSIETSDYETPLFEAEEDEHAHEAGSHDDEDLLDHVANSHSDIESFGFGGSYTYDKGYIGLSYSDYASTYGVPNHEKSIVSIDKKKLSLQSVRELDSGYFDRMDFQMAYGEYSHEEAAGEDEDHGNEDHGGEDHHHAQFLYEGIESRIIFSKQTDDSRTALSLSYIDSDMKIDGEESYLAAMEHNAINNSENYPGEAIDPTNTSLTDAIIPESTNPVISNDSAKRFGVGVMHKKDLSNSFSINGGLRYETLSRDYDALDRDNDTLAVDIDRDHSCINGSIGFIQKYSDTITFSGNLHYSERIPETSELYSSGAHHATESFEIGNPDLANEESVGIELALINQQGAFTQKVSAYFNDYSNFIYQEDSGFVTGSHEIASQADVDADTSGELALYDPLEAFEELTIRQYQGAEAEIYGFEYTFDYKLSPKTYLKGFADTISAKNKSDGIALPRIPPWRLGIGYYLESDQYKFSLNAVHHGEQDDLASGESITEAYTTVNARLGYYLNQEDRGSELYLRVKNLTDELGFVHTSFLKGSAPIAGRSVELGLNLQF